MSCLRCGECCLPYQIKMDAGDDARRWLTYHGLTVRDIDENSMLLMGQSLCFMLVFNKDGTTSCGCYQDRPEICKQYLCKRAKETE